MDIHIYSKSGQIDKVREILDDTQLSSKSVNAFDDAGLTPLMLAAKSPGASVELMQLLLDGGANINAVSRGSYHDGRSVLSHALGAGDPEKVAILLQHGADIHYRHDGDYDAIIDAVQGRDITQDARLIDLLKLLIEHGARIDGQTRYCESGVRVTSNRGRFDAVALLLKAGADEKALGWSPLMNAIALGTTEEVRSTLEAGAALETRDSWQRTPWLLAIQTGDTRKAQLLRDSGADTEARGRAGKPPLFYAIGNGHHEMLLWLLDLGMDPEQHDDSGTTALIESAEYGDPIAIDMLLSHGAKVDRGKFDSSPEHDERLRQLFGDLGENPLPLPEISPSEETALSYARSGTAALRLLAAGADPARLTREARRRMTGLNADPTDEYRLIALDDYLQGRYRRFGRANPELTNEPFWLAMVRSGSSAWMATQHFKDDAAKPDKPVWCADRFGQSLSLLPDGRMVEIGGEHEDGYDPDFSIYNDVFVHDGKGGIQIYSYPEKEFPPTDFHTATAVDKYIYIIGSLGYDDARQYDITPVYRLNLDNFHIDTLHTTGEMPGWIYGHRASLSAGTRIHVTGGTLCTLKDGEEQHISNQKEFFLDLESMTWSSLAP